MSYVNTKNALVNNLLDNLPAGVTANDVAFENRKLIGHSESLWLATYFLPVSSGSLGKDLDDDEERLGIFQISVFVRLNNNNFDDDQLTAIDEILSAFRNTTELVYNGQRVKILNSTVNNGVESGAYFKRDISINYLTITQR